MNTAKDIIVKLMEDLLLEKQEEEEIWSLIKTDERLSSEEVKSLIL